MKRFLVGFTKIIYMFMITIFLGVFCLNTRAMAARDTSHPNVLFLSSYAYSWASVPYQIQGIESVLMPITNMDYVFMNTKEISYADTKGIVRERIQQHIRVDGQYDAILIGDDAALDFALEYQSELFPQVPIVFMGINTSSKANKAHENPMITGMIENFPYYETVDLAYKMYPDAKRIIGISDNTISGQGCVEEFLKQRDKFPSLDFQVMNTSQMTQQEIAEELEGLDQDTILIFLSLVNDKDGNIYSAYEATVFVENHSPIPMFKADMVGIGQGVTGGFVSSYVDMGAAAAKQIQQVLSGISPQDIAVEKMSGYPMFDYQMVEKYHLNKSLIPTNTVFLNQTKGFYDEYYTQIWVGIFTFIVLLTMMSLSLVNVKERHNKALKAALQKAERATKAKTDFLARMSHDMRTPMNAIIGLSALTIDDADNPEAVRNNMSKMRQASDFLLGLVNDILDMAKIEDGSVSLKMEPYTYSTFLRNMKTMFKPLCEAKNITITFVEPVHIDPTGMTDILRLNQIFFNVFSNAVKYTPEGGTISCSVANISSDGKKIYGDYIIKDNGIGMSEEFKARMFDPFARENNKIVADLQGSGLGLSITKQLVELMGGTIRIESTQGVGTTVIIHMGFELAEKPQDPAEQGQNQQDDFERLHDKKVLLVEDHPMNAEIATRILKKHQMEVNWAENGQVAVDLFKASDINQFDVILMDIRMPIMSGLESTAMIRNLPREDAQTVPIIAMSANAYPEDIQKSLEAGMNDHLAKPVNPDVLYQTILKVL